MTAGTIRQIISATPPPINVYTSDRRVIYVDHPESVIVSDEMIAIGSGVNGGSGVVKDIILLANNHIVRVERMRRKALRRTA